MKIPEIIVQFSRKSSIFSCHAWIWAGPFTNILDSSAAGPGATCYNPQDQFDYAIEVLLGADLSTGITGDFIPDNWNFDIWVSVHAPPILLIFLCPNSFRCRIQLGLLAPSGVRVSTLTKLYGILYIV
jgi:hypothetical protein